MRNVVRPSSIINASADVAACELDGGAALIDLKSGDYFKLNETAHFFWSLIGTPRSLKDIMTAMADHYDVDAAVLDADVRALVADLSQQGLIVVEI